ncbi:MAG: murein transglycosylase A [Maritimibacter sp.]
MRAAWAWIAAGVLALGTSSLSAAPKDAEVSLLPFSALEGWERDDHNAGLEAFLETCRLLDDARWRAICALGESYDGPAKTFFELFFRPVLIEDGAPALFTGYFEPELYGSRTQTARFRYPLYAKPPELAKGTRFLTRKEIEVDGLLRGRGLEIAWLEDPVELQFLHIQGSGRVRLTDGTSLRLGYSANNGHTFRSLGDELVRRGIYNKHQVSAEVIKNWVARNPIEGREVLNHNGSYVFFTVLDRLPADKGPVGAMNRSITAGRTLAVDPKYTPLGAPVWLEKQGASPFAKLMVAQDTGSRIKGAQRADVFYGTGDEAGRVAGRIKDGGRMVVLLPIQRALALVPED